MRQCIHDSPVLFLFLEKKEGPEKKDGKLEDPKERRSSRSVSGRPGKQARIFLACGAYVRFFYYVNFVSTMQIKGVTTITFRTIPSSYSKCYDKVFENVYRFNISYLSNMIVFEWINILYKQFASGTCYNGSNNFFAFDFKCFFFL